MRIEIKDLKVGIQYFETAYGKKLYFQIKDVPYRIENTKNVADGWAVDTLEGNRLFVSDGNPQYGPKIYRDRAGL